MHGAGEVGGWSSKSEDLREQSARRYVKCTGDFDYIQQADIPLSALNSTNVGPMQVGSFG